MGKSTYDCYRWLCAPTQKSKVRHEKLHSLWQLYSVRAHTHTHTVGTPCVTSKTRRESILYCLFSNQFIEKETKIKYEYCVYVPSHCCEWVIHHMFVIVVQYKDRYLLNRTELKQKPFISRKCLRHSMCNCVGLCITIRFWYISIQVLRIVCMQKAKQKYFRLEFYPFLKWTRTIRIIIFCYDNCVIDRTHERMTSFLIWLVQKDGICSFFFLLLKWSLVNNDLINERYENVTSIIMFLCAAPMDRESCIATCYCSICVAIINSQVLKLSISFIHFRCTECKYFHLDRAARADVQRL